jgi:hypothetical protein
MFLRGPAVRERAGKHGDGEIGRCVAVGNGFDDARRHEGERGEVPDVAFDLILASGISSNELTRPSLRSFIQERARAMAVSNRSLVAPRKPSRSGRDLPLVAQCLAFVTVIGRRRRRGRSRIDNRHVRRLVSDVEIAGLENFTSNVACSGHLPHRMEVYGHSGDSGALTRRSEVMRGL